LFGVLNIPHCFNTFFLARLHDTFASEYLENISKNCWNKIIIIDNAAKQQVQTIIPSDDPNEASSENNRKNNSIPITRTNAICFHTIFIDDAPVILDKIRRIDTRLPSLHNHTHPTVEITGAAGRFHEQQTRQAPGQRSKAVMGILFLDGSWR